MSIETAITDALTGLEHRRYMEEPRRYTRRTGLGARQAVRALVLDIDDLKSINESHGNDAGDDVLREFAIRIRDSSA